MVTVQVCRSPRGSLAALKCTKGASSLRRGLLVLALWLTEALELEFPCGPPGIRWARGTRSRSRPILSPCRDPLWAPLREHSHPTLPRSQGETEISVLKGPYLLTEGEHLRKRKGLQTRKARKQGHVILARHPARAPGTN